jgi:multidrug resistance efflux pump
MRRLVLCFVAIAALARLTGAAETTPPTVANVSHCVVAAADQADMPPQEAGVIDEIPVIEGQQVSKGELLVQLNASKAKAELNVAEAKLHAATTKAKASDINVKYANAAEKVADAELQVNNKANQNYPGSVPWVRINELGLKCTETKLAITKAESDREIADEEAKVAKAEVDAADVMVKRHEIRSPVDGVVVEIRAHKGEAVQPTQAVIHVVKLDSLWVEGFVPAKDFARSQLEGQDVTIDVDVAAKLKSTLRGKIIFVKPLTETGERYMVRARVENRKVSGSWLLTPGTQVEMSIQVRKLPSEDGLR